MSVPPEDLAPRPEQASAVGHWRWPLGALLTWLAAWACYAAAMRVWPSPAGAGALGVAVGLLATLATRRWWRKLLLTLGFPLSALVVGSLNPWAWALALLGLLVVYGPQSWRDAPLFPTPHAALDGLPLQVSLASGALILEAGCGLGHGLMALRRAYPQARIDALEFSAPLAWLAAWRCPWARVRRGDMWTTDWSGYDLVYMFQRPETMARAAAKAALEQPPGAWLVSLAFAVPGIKPTAQYALPNGMVVYAYRQPLQRARP